MKEWRVLPTDPRFQDLTAEQRALLWEDFLLDHPEIAKEIEKDKTKTIYDDEFDELWEELDRETASEDDWEEVEDDWEETED